MKLVIASSTDQQMELTESSDRVEWIHIDHPSQFADVTDADGYFDLFEHRHINYQGILKPVFINSVIDTLDDLKLPPPIIRINGWNGFLKRKTWEIAGSPDDSAMKILEFINKEVIHVNDEPGFVSGRIISMIINEAYFALADNVSSEQDVDIAMKLGTNYPKGPFEWGKEIGLHNILGLLEKLCADDERYLPCNLLKSEALKSA
jgi:3-hydroxybutyryl-CoA dehydrogenase